MSFPIMVLHSTVTWILALPYMSQGSFVPARAASVVCELHAHVYEENVVGARGRPLRWKLLRNGMHASKQDAMQDFQSLPTDDEAERIIDDARRHDP